VGTGGKGEDEPQQGKNDPLMQVRKVGTVGVLRLSLRADSYSWKFVPVEGESFTDSGSDRCHS
jgi:acid phosphatase type 7